MFDIGFHIAFIENSVFVHNHIFVKKEIAFNKFFCGAAATQKTVNGKHPDSHREVNNGLAAELHYFCLAKIKPKRIYKLMTKAAIKQVRLLHQKKYRDEKGLFIAEGPKIVNDLLNSTYKAKEIFATKEFRIQSRWLSGSELRIHEVNEKELESISALTTPNRILGVFEIPSSLILRPSSFASELVLALDDIRDPGNFGTIIRIADWFGINHILCSETCVDVYNPKVVQASMGSIARVELHCVSLEEIFKSLRKEPFGQIYGAVMNSKNIYTENLSSKGIILIGNESRGISENLMQYVTQKISIPNFGKADSLNAAIATAVICSEFRRKH